MAKKKSGSDKTKQAPKRKWKLDTITIVQYLLLVCAIVVFIVLMAIGFKHKDNQPPQIANISIETPENQDIPAIQEPDSLYDQMIGKAYKVESYWYNLSDSEFDQHNMYAIRGRLGKILLETPEEVNGNKFDLIYFDRVHKLAFGRCSMALCTEKDYDFDALDYEKYYMLDPLEWMYRLMDRAYTGDEMLGNQIAKVFNITYQKRPGKVWLMEYYGLPMKIEFETESGTRTIEFKDLHVNDVNIGNVMLPINFTVDNSKEYTYGWFGYMAAEFDEELKYR